MTTQATPVPARPVPPPQRGFGQQRGATDKEHDMADLTGKTALVTGASRGIGQAIARRLAADGALVAVHYGNSQAAATETVAAIQADGGMAFPVRAELGVDGDVDTLFAGLEAGLSGQRLDILVNNAATRAAAFIEQATPKEFDRMFAVNVRAPLFIIQRALPLLRDGGRIINISSSDTRVALPLELAYAMTKGAVNVMSQTLANALGARGITVNAVAPGPTDTDMTAFMGDPEVRAATASATALGRVGDPADIADAVAFLASDDARWITGQLLDVTGGMWLGAPHVSAASPAPLPKGRTPSTGLLCQLTWRHAMQHQPIPRREGATPRRPARTQPSPAANNQPDLYRGDHHAWVRDLLQRHLRGPWRTGIPRRSRRHGGACGRSPSLTAWTLGINGRWSS
jgi:3-oxoacyl-[acyl-carrier protein] reductase